LVQPGHKGVGPHPSGQFPQPAARLVGHRKTEQRKQPPQVLPFAFFAVLRGHPPRNPQCIAQLKQFQHIPLPHIISLVEGEHGVAKLAQFQPRRVLYAEKRAEEHLLVPVEGGDMHGHASAMHQQVAVRHDLLPLADKEFAHLLEPEKDALPFLRTEADFAQFHRHQPRKLQPRADVLFPTPECVKHAGCASPPGREKYIGIHEAGHIVVKCFQNHTSSLALVIS